MTLLEDTIRRQATAEKVVKLKREKDLWTEERLARVFAAEHAEHMKYDHNAGTWYVWTGTRWEREETRLASDLLRAIAKRANVKALLRMSALSGAERMAQADRLLATTATTWDRDPFLLGTPGGTVDLKTGEVQPAQQKDFITRHVSVAPAPPGTFAPRWNAFLRDATRDDEELVEFLRQITGYALTGDTREHALFFVYGPGGNGKGVFLNTVTRILGDYATTAPMDTFVASAADKHPTDLAGLKGARLVSASETEEGRRWAEARIKSITGGDPITARFMRRDFFTYQPSFKLVIVGNHKPVLQNVDDAARRRFNIIPFVHKPEVVDLELEAKLEPEHPAILRWMLDGCQDWQDRGLVRPRVVLEATENYFNDQDLFGVWLSECTVAGSMKSDSHANLYRSWMGYAEANGEKPGSGKAFTAMMEKRGFTRRRTGQVRVFDGLWVKAASQTGVTDDR